MAKVNTTGLTPEQVKNLERATELSEGLSNGSIVNVDDAPKKSSSDDFIATLQDRLMKESDMVSSADSRIESEISKAISAVNKGNDASKARIESEYTREMGALGTNLSAKEIDFSETGRGGAIPMVAFRLLKEDNAKQIKDLQQRKEELLLAGDAQAASTISNLILKKLEFEQQAQQATFQNLLGMGNFALNARNQQIQADQFERNFGLQERQQSFYEKSALSEIALAYGINLNEGDTIDTVVSRAMPFASEKQKLELAKLKAEINNANVQAAKALRGEQVDTIDDTTASILATAFRNGDTGFLSNLKGEENAGKVYGEVVKQREAEAAELADIANSVLASGGSDKDFMARVQNSSKAYSQDDAAAVAAAVFSGKAAPKQGGGFFNSIVGMIDKPTADRMAANKKREAEQKSGLQKQFDYYKGISASRELTIAEKNIVQSLRNSARMQGITLQ